MFTPAQRKLILLSGIGSALEFYDFIIFVFFAPILGQLFFPSDENFVSLLKTYGLFAVGYLMRPLGGVFFGHFGDRLGRKKIFITTILMITIPTCLIGCLPTYSHIGILAPCLLVFLRLIQGFSAGGEIPGALVFVTEATPTERRSLVCALIFFGVNGGMLLGSAVSVVLEKVLLPYQMETWGWRLVFLIGGLLGIISFYLRRQLYETPLFKEMQNTKKVYAFPLLEVIKKTPVKAFQGIILTSFSALSVSLFFLFMPTYLSLFFKYPIESMKYLNFLLLILSWFLVLIVGYWADKIGYLRTMQIGAGALALLSYPSFALMAHSTFTQLVMLNCLLIISMSFVNSSITTILVGLFSTRIRFSGVALAYNLGFGIVGGITPLSAIYLIHKLHNVLAPSFLLVGLSFTVFGMCFFMKETRGIALTNL